MSSLRGLTHVLTCEHEAKTPFSVYIPQHGPPLVATSSRLVRGESSTVCGGLTLNMAARVISPTRLAMVLPIQNKSSYLWRGSVKLVLGKTSIPVDIGSVPAGSTRTAEVPFDVAVGNRDHIGDPSWWAPRGLAPSLPKLFISGKQLATGTIM